MTVRETLESELAKRQLELGGLLQAHENTKARLRSLSAELISQRDDIDSLTETIASYATLIRQQMKGQAS